MPKLPPSGLVAGVLVASSPEAVKMCSDALRVSPSFVMIFVMVATRRRLKDHRRFSTFVGDVGMTICDTCVQLDNTLYQVQDDVSGPTYQMVSTMQLIDHPAIMSTLDDVGTWSCRQGRGDSN